MNAASPDWKTLQSEIQIEEALSLSLKAFKSIVFELEGSRYSYSVYKLFFAWNIVNIGEIWFINLLQLLLLFYQSYFILLILCVLLSMIIIFILLHLIHDTVSVICFAT